MSAVRDGNTENNAEIITAVQNNAAQENPGLDESGPLTPEKNSQQTENRVGLRQMQYLSRSEDSWWPEIIYLTISVVILIILACVFAIFDGNPVPRMKYGITLNAVISILATVAPLTLTVSISEGLGQLKWTRYEQDEGRSLYDLEVYDAASRGPVGSFCLLFKHRRRDILALFGAMVTLISLAFGPFAQQCVSYPQRPTVLAGRSASMARAQSYVGHGSSGESADYLETTMIQAIYNGLLAGVDGTLVSPTYDCLTGNCTFPSFNSLAICSVCANVTAKTTMVREAPLAAVEGEVYQHDKFTFPSGVVVDVSEEYKYPTINFTDPTSADYLSWNTTYGPDLGDLYNLVLAFSALRMPQDQVTIQVFEAVECALHLCVQTYHDVEIRSGRASQGSILSWHATSGVPFHSDGYQNYSLVPDGIVAEYSPIDYNTYSIDLTTVQLFARYIEEFMSLDCQPTIAPTLGQGGGKDGCIPGLLFQILAGSSNVSWPILMASLTTSMTNAMRNRGNDTGPNAAPGAILTQRVFVHTEWGWLALPIAVVVGAMVFVLFATSRKGKNGAKIPIWKTTALPVMLHGLQTYDTSHHKQCSDMQRFAKETRVWLMEDENGYRRLVNIPEREA